MLTEDFIQQARSQLLESGDYMPTLFVETDKGTDLVAVAGMPEMGPARQHYFFSMGRRIAQSSGGATLRTLIFISETWTSRGNPDGSRRFPKPEQDPDRGESLMIIGVDLTFTPLTVQGVFLDMERDTAGKLVDAVVRHFEGKLTPNLLYRFIAGWKSAPYSEIDLIRMMLSGDGDLHA
jgi:hypothetical protein